MTEDELVHDACRREREELMRSNLRWFDEAKEAQAEAESLKTRLAEANAEIVRLTSIAVRANVCPGRGLVGTGGVSL
jgi:hypothetical protein